MPSGFKSESLSGINRNLHFSANGRFLALDTEERAHIWDLENRALVTKLPIAKHSQLAFAGANGARLLASNLDGTVSLVWQPSKLIDLACQAFADDGWRQSRFRLTGFGEQGPCHAESRN